jgi:hypothetical protein
MEMLHRYICIQKDCKDSCRCPGVYKKGEYSTHHRTKVDTLAVVAIIAVFERHAALAVIEVQTSDYVRWMHVVA